MRWVVLNFLLNMAMNPVSDLPVRDHKAVAHSNIGSIASTVSQDSKQHRCLMGPAIARPSKHSRWRAAELTLPFPPFTDFPPQMAHWRLLAEVYSFSFT
jgi:hypothetical protein